MSMTRQLARAVRHTLLDSSLSAESTSPAAHSSRRTRNRIAGAVATTLIAASPGVFAQSNIDGYVYGTAPAGADSAIVLENVDTGAKREIKPDLEGRFRFSAVQAGRYKVTLKSGATTQEKMVAVTLGNGVGVTFDDQALIGTVEVVATGIAPVDIQKTETSFNIGEATIDAIPVARNLTAISLLAPGSVMGDEGFGNLPSFGGSTVAENQYYLNGFNISDLRTRLGPSTVPFEFFEQFEVKSGGYSAEFGRATGGVVNAISKRGTNEFKFGANAFFEPDWGRPRSKTYRNRSTGEVAYYYGDDSLEKTNFNAYASGPIIEDKLFFFILGQFSSTEETKTVQSRDHALDYVKGTTYREETVEAPFGALKLDWQIADGHHLELTGFTDGRTDERDNYLYDLETVTIGDATGPSEVERGGKTYIGRYTGQFTDSFTFSALYGHGETELNGIPSNQDCPLVNDNRTGVSQVGCFVGNPTFDSDERNAYRVDFTWAPDFDLAGRHVVKFGADLEENESTSETNLSGGSRYRLNRFAAGGNIGNGPAPVTGDYVRVQRLSSAGTIEEELSAVYLEDTWSITDDFTVYLGLRNESFEYKTVSTGDTYVKFDGELAPRLGMSWDFMGEGTSKLYANYGRYYLPLATQAAVRNQLGELFDSHYYFWDGTFSNDRYSIPGLGAQVGNPVVTSDGEIKDPLTLVDQNLKPSYQDEYILGFETELPELFGKNSVGGIRFIYRDLGRTAEDAALDAALNAKLNNDPNAALQDCGGGDMKFACGFDYYFITNPGQDATIYVDVDGDGTIEPVTVSAADSGLDEPERKYYAVELTYERQFDRHWYLQGSYTWSQSYGNYEGIVNSAIEQDDIAITQDFDQPGFLDGARGYTASDRRHKVKLYGAWSPIDPLLLGANLSVFSGRPVSAYAVHPTDEFAAAYDEFSFFQCADSNSDGDCSDAGEHVLTPRGSYDRTPWTYALDLSAKYSPIEGLSFAVDVFNVFNSRKATELNERSEDGGSPNTLFLAPVEVQTPRYYRFSLSYEF